MRHFSAWVIAILLLPVCTLFCLQAEEGAGASKPEVQFIAPSDASKSSTKSVGSKSETTNSEDDAAFINPENAQPEEGVSSTQKSPAESPEVTQLNQTVLRKVQVRGLRETAKKADDNSEAALGPIEPATNIGFAPGITAKDSPEAPGDNKDVPKPFLLDEKNAHDVVKGGFAAPSAQGAMAYFKGKSLVETSFYQAAQRAVEKNLSVRFADKGYEKSGYAISRAKAVFDPVFSLTLNGTQSDSFARREFIDRKRFIAGELENEIVGAIFNTITDTQPADPVEGFHRRGAFDSAGERGRFRSETVTENFFLQMPWGPVFNANFQQKHAKSIFQEFTSEDSFNISDTDASGNQLFDADGQTPLVKSVFFQQHGRFARDRQQRPWSSTLSLRLIVPLPYTKDWGPYGSAEVPIKLTETAQERAYWDLQSAITNTLLNVDLAYWDLVRTIRRLELTIETRRGMEKVLGQTQELLKANRATGYEETQIKQQVAGIRRGEQGEWARYVAASNALKNLLDEDKDTVILPVNYGAMLAADAPMASEDAMTLAMANNPDLQAAKTDVQAADISLKFANNQAKPDLKLTTGMTWAESSANYGYSGVGPSIASLMRPDRRDGFAVLNYTVPWGNKPAEARVDESEERYKQAQKRLALIANNVDRKIHDSATLLSSARERSALAEKNKELADNLYKTVLELWEKGRVPPLAADRSNPAFEIVNKNNDVLSAGFRLIDAQIDVRQQEAQLLAAEGLIASRYSAEFNIKLKRMDEPKKDAKDAAKDAVKETKDAGKEAVKEPAKEQK